VANNGPGYQDSTPSDVSSTPKPPCCKREFLITDPCIVRAALNHIFSADLVEIDTFVHKTNPGFPLQNALFMEACPKERMQSRLFMEVCPKGRVQSRLFMEVCPKGRL